MANIMWGQLTNLSLKAGQPQDFRIFFSLNIHLDKTRSYCCFGYFFFQLPLPIFVVAQNAPKSQLGVSSDQNGHIWADKNWRKKTAEI